MIITCAICDQIVNGSDCCFISDGFLSDDGFSFSIVATFGIVHRSCLARPSQAIIGEGKYPISDLPLSESCNPHLKGQRYRIGKGPTADETFVRKASGQDLSKKAELEKKTKRILFLDEGEYKESDE